MDEANKQSDEEIAKAVQDGETELFGALIERYAPKILRYGKRFLYQYEDVEDAVQDTFLKAYVNIQSFNSEMRFSPWIYRIAHNTFINIIKKKGREPVALFDSDTILGNTAGNENPEEDLIRQEMRQILDKTLKNLPIKYREPLVLYFYEEKNYKEIADIMRIPTSTAGVRIKRGKDKIKELYKENYG